MPPTLISKGAVQFSEFLDSEDKSNIKQIRAIDYIMSFIKRRLNTKLFSAKYQPHHMGHRVILLRSGTGSGKSTSIAPELYMNFQDVDRRDIIITQPRVLTAIDKAQDMAANYPKLKLGDNIGYSTGGYKCQPRSKGITSMTPGIFKNMLATSTPEEIAKKYGFFIIDEIHEKDIETETNLYLFKQFLSEYWKEDNCPFLILMSATFNPEPYAKYFDCPKCNFIEVEGRTFPITPIILRMIYLIICNMLFILCFKSILIILRN